MKKILPSIAALLIGCASFVSTASADTVSLKDIVAGLKSFGCAMSSTKAGALTRVQVQCDQQKVIDNFPVLQKMGMMNPDITQTQINMMPSALAAVFLQEVTATLIHPLYQSTPAQETEWSSSLVVADAYGHAKAHTVFTFRFNRAIDARVNWDNFNDANLPKIAPNYVLTPWGNQVFSDLN